MHLRTFSFLGGLALFAGGAVAVAAPDEPAGTPLPDQQAPAPNSATMPNQAEQPNRASQRNQQQPELVEQADPEQHQWELSLISAEELVGRDVMTKEGEKIGTLKFVTVSLEEGEVSHLLIDTAGTEFAQKSAQQSDATQQPGGTQQPGMAQSPGSADEYADEPAMAGTEGAGTAQAPGGSRAASDDGLLIVPWAAASENAEREEFIIAATAAQLNNAPRLANQQLRRLTQPTMASYVVDYWAPASELAAMETGRQTGQGAESGQGGEAGQQQGQQQQPERAQQGQQMGQSPGSQQQAGADRQAAQPGQQQAGTDRQQAQPGQQEQPGQQAPGAGDDGEPQQLALVGRELVTAVTPPMFQLSRQFRGSRVLDDTGESIGEIRQIMIDQTTGKAAFAVVEGTSAGRAPVPLQALEWTSEETTVLEADPSLLASNRGLTEDPEQASRDDLAQLYQRYDVQPFWQADAQSASQQQSQEGAIGP